MLRTLLILITSLVLYITPIYNQCNIPGFLDDIENNPALSNYFDELYGTGDALGKLKYERGFKAWEKALNRILPESWRVNPDFLEPFAKALDEKPKIDLHMRGHIYDGKAVGCHLSSAIDNINVRLRSTQPTGLPEYFPDGKLKKAAIDIKDSDGNWIPKDANSTFFPGGWDEDKILEEIAFVRSQPANKINDRKWIGAASDGTQIQVEYTGPLNDLTFNTAYPVN